MKVKLNIQISALSFLIIFNLFIFVLVLLSRSILGSGSFTEEDFVTFGGLLIKDGQVNQVAGILAANFFHIDIIHMSLNMYALWRLGEITERFYGGTKLFIIYIMGGIGASLFSGIFYIAFDSDLAGLGASGSVFALVGVLIGGSMKKYRYGNSLPFSVWDFMPMIILSLLIDVSDNIRINHLAHFGGLITGIVLGLIFKHSFEYFEDSLDKLVVKVFFHISLFLFFSSYLLLILNLIF